MDNLEINLPANPETCPRCKGDVGSEDPYCKRCKLFFRLETVGKVTTGKCLYCPFVGQLSQEHILPNWITGIYSRRSKKSFRRFGRPQRLDLWEASPRVHKVIDINRDIYDLTIYNVCRHCNTGWMSGLQDEAKPLVVRLANGERPEFTNTEQTTLSRWAVMIALNLHSVNKTVLSHQNALEHLKTGGIPSGWKIYISKIIDDSLAGHAFNVIRYVPIGAPEDPLSCNVSYFCVEKVMFFIVNTFGDRSFSYLKYGGFDMDQISIDFNFRSIWPKNEDGIKTKDAYLDRNKFEKINHFLGG